MKTTPTPPFEPPEIPVPALSFQLFTIDPTNGELTKLGEHGLEFISAPAFQPNQSPVANAGPDQLDVECTGAPAAGCATVTLDGTGSSDPDDDALTYLWMPGGHTGAVFEDIILKVGTHVFTLTVDDGKGGTDTDTVTVTVVDTTAPTVNSATASPNTLWSPNHKMVYVMVTVDASDLCGGDAVCQITSVLSNEPDNGKGDGNTTNDIVITGDLTMQLRAERSGQGHGRIYTIHIECVDETGNASVSSVTVTVPKSQGKSKSSKSKSGKSKK